MIHGGEEEAGVVIGSVSTTRYGHETWVGNGWIGYLGSGRKLHCGHWRDRGEQWAFAPVRLVDEDVIRARPEWFILDAYWGERAELVLDETLPWHRARFVARDAVELEDRGGVWRREAEASAVGGRKVIEGGWDHEHCVVCWEKLGSGGQSEGYFSPSGTWACGRCLAEFIDKRSLEFIPEAE